MADFMSRKWSEVTWLHMLELSTSPVAKEVATQLVSGYTLYTDGLPEVSKILCFVFTEVSLQLFILTIYLVHFTIII